MWVLAVAGVCMRLAVLAVGWAFGRVPWGHDATVSDKHNIYQELKWSEHAE